jgi:hypothetical protein
MLCNAARFSGSSGPLIKTPGLPPMLAAIAYWAARQAAAKVWRNFMVIDQLKQQFTGWRCSRREYKKNSRSQEI